MGRPLKTKKSTTKDIGFNMWSALTDPVYSSTFNSDQFLGVVGGSSDVSSAAYPVVKCTAYIPGDSQYRSAFIIRQKGNTKYMVAAPTAIQDEDIVAGNTYYINSAGNTNWRALGGPANAQSGDVFTATVSGAGLGTTGVVYLVGICVLVDDATPASGFMSIALEYGDSTSVTIAKLTNKFALDYSDNRYAVNFFTDEGSQIKSGTIGVTLPLGVVENYTP